MTLKRIQKLEEPKIGLMRWYEDSKRGITASFFDRPGDATMRICTPKGCEEVGFPFASLKKQPEHWFRETTLKWAKRIG